MNIIHVWMAQKDFLAMFAESGKINNGVVSIPWLKHVVDAKMKPLEIPDDAKVLTMSFNQKKRRHPELPEVDVIGIRLMHADFPELAFAVPDYYAAPYDVANGPAFVRQIKVYADGREEVVSALAEERCGATVKR